MKPKTLALMLLSATGGLLVAVSAVCYLYGYRFNTGISYPSGLYQLTRSTAAYHKGELVLFCPPDNTTLQLALQRDYIKPGTCQGGFTPVIKKVAAMAGDTVTFDSVVRINAQQVPSAVVMATDSRGRTLPHPLPVTLSDGQYLMMSDHRPVISFDSRYYGPVPAAKMIGHIHPVQTW